LRPQPVRCDGISIQLGVGEGGVKTGGGTAAAPVALGGGVVGSARGGGGGSW
jgi:hypothetical protein